MSDDDMVLVRRDDLRAMLRAVEFVAAKHAPPIGVLRNVRAVLNGEATSRGVRHVRRQVPPAFCGSVDNPGDTMNTDDRLAYDEDDAAEHWPCPMGCGRTTEDVYGGPCEACWDEVPKDGEDA